MNKYKNAWLKLAQCFGEQANKEALALMCGIMAEESSEKWSKKYPLNTRLVRDGMTFRYIIDKDGYRWIPESVWERHARKWLRRAKFEFKLITGEIIKA